MYDEKPKRGLFKLASLSSSTTKYKDHIYFDNYENLMKNSKVVAIQKSVWDFKCERCD